MHTRFVLATLGVVRCARWSWFRSRPEYARQIVHTRHRPCCAAESRRLAALAARRRLATAR